MPDDRSQALILYMFAAIAGVSFRAAVYFDAWHTDEVNGQAASLSLTALSF
jgi:hypothetical protein